MMAEWQSYLLEDCMEAIIDYRGKTPRKTTSGIPLVTAKIVKGGRILPVSEYIAEEDYDSWMQRGLPKKGDIVLTTEAPLGEIAQLDGRKVALAQRLITLRGNPDILDNNYLKFLLLSAPMQEQLQARASGTTVVGIKQSELRKIVLPLPPLPEQQAIAGVLSALDKKIELNRRMNATLEVMARALFKSWFVDFIPVRAKMEGRALDGLSADIAALFPDTLVDSPLGEIPKGWEVKTLAEIVALNPSERIPKDSVAPYLDMAALPTTGFFSEEPRPRKVSSGSRFKNGDTLLARITPCLENGKTAYVTELEEQQIGWGSTEFIVMRPKAPCPAEYGYLLARDENFRTFAIQSMTGSSGRQRVPVEALGRYEIVMPPASLMEQFGVFVRPLFKKSIAAMRENQTLSQLRDTLLPKLISGHLRVTDTASSIKEVV